MPKADDLNIYSLEDLAVGLESAGLVRERVSLDNFSPYTIHTPDEIDIYAQEHLRQKRGQTARAHQNIGIFKVKKTK